jgi:hypothetical protein
MRVRSAARGSTRFAATLAAVAAAIVTQAAPCARRAEPAFRFQNNFWVNLHHLLRGESRRRGLHLPLRVDPTAMTPAERAAWSDALDRYAPYGGRDLVALVSDPGLIPSLGALNNMLTLVADDRHLDAPELPADVRTALTEAAPVYRAHGWANQQAVNAAWIAAVRPLVARYGAALADAIAAAYRSAWSTEPYLVDACAEAGPDGGYTIDGPPGTAAHTTIEAANPEYQGDMALEMLFHEASHTEAMAGRVRAEIARVAADEHVETQPDLWHAVIFYTTGELARRVLGKTNDPTYLPAGDRYHVYDRRWKTARAALGKDWQPYLDGRVDYETALRALVRDASQAP